MSTDTIVLRCVNVGVRFGALKAVDDFSYDFHLGRTFALIGPNGAGKTTLLNVLSGRLARHTGRILCREQDITRFSPQQRAHAGIGRSFQITKIFPELSVLDNLRIAAQVAHRTQTGRRMPFWPSPAYEQYLHDDVEAVLGLTGLEEQRHAMAGTLSYGMQRALELGITLMPNPQVLLLDEPLAGCGQHEIAAAITLIQRAAQGRTVILVEHNMDVVMRLADCIVVMAQGRMIADGSPEQIRNNANVRAVYLGEEAA